MQRPIEFEVGPEPPVDRNWAALAASAAVHLLVILLLVFGVPSSSASSVDRASSRQVAQPLAVQPELPRFKVPPKRTETPRPQPPPPPMKEVELGPDSKKPDERAKEAAAKQSDAEPATVAAPPAPDPVPPPPATANGPPEGRSGNPGADE